MRTNKTHIDVVAKRSLSGHLRDPEKYIPLIERRVEYTSKLQQLGSLLVNQYIVKKLNNGETQFLDQLHITSGARSGLLKGIFRTAMLLFTDDNRAPHPNAPATAPELRALHEAELRPRFDKLEKLAYFGKALEDCNGDSFPKFAAIWIGTAPPKLHKVRTRQSRVGVQRGRSLKGVSRDHCSERRSRTPRGTRRLCAKIGSFYTSVRWMWRTWTTPSFRMI